MPFTHKQTIEVFFPWTTVTHYAIGTAPVPPEWVTESNEHEAVVNGECVTAFWKNGTTDVYNPDGTIKRFWPKPTIKDAVLWPKNVGTYIRFHTNGDVEQVLDGVPYYWGPSDLKADIVRGQPLAARVERCEEPGAFGAFSIYDQEVRFDILPGSYLEKRSCDCSDCYFDVRQRLYRRQNAVSCSCIECRDSDCEDDCCD